MTITAKYKTNEVRWSPTVLFDTDTGDAGDIIFNYAGELGADTVSTAGVKSENITAGAPSITNNTVTVNMSAAQAGVSKMELTINTAGGSVLTTLVRFRAVDYYDNL